MIKVQKYKNINILKGLLLLWAHNINGISRFICKLELLCLNYSGVITYAIFTLIPLPAIHYVELFRKTYQMLKSKKITESIVSASFAQKSQLFQHWKFHPKTIHIIYFLNRLSFSKLIQWYSSRLEKLSWIAKNCQPMHII